MNENCFKVKIENQQRTNHLWGFFSRDKRVSTATMRKRENFSGKINFHHLMFMNYASVDLEDVVTQLMNKASDWTSLNTIRFWISIQHRIWRQIAEFVKFSDLHPQTISTHICKYFMLECRRKICKFSSLQRNFVVYCCAWKSDCMRHLFFYGNSPSVLNQQWYLVSRNYLCEGSSCGHLSIGNRY